MGTEDKQGVVTMQELLVSSLARADAVAKLMIEKGLITQAEFTQRLSATRAVGFPRTVGVGRRPIRGGRRGHGKVLPGHLLEFGQGRGEHPFDDVQAHLLGEAQ